MEESGSNKRGRESPPPESEKEEAPPSKTAKTETKEHEPEPGISVGVVGWREFRDYALLKRTLDSILANRRVSEIVSGGARGADALAARYARERSIPLRVFEAQWKVYGLSAGPKRNARIVQRSDLVVAFWNGESKGTGDTIRQAREAGKELRVIRIDAPNAPKSRPARK